MDSTIDVLTFQETIKENEEIFKDLDLQLENGFGFQTDSNYENYSNISSPDSLDFPPNSQFNINLLTQFSAAVDPPPCEEPKKRGRKRHRKEDYEGDVSAVQLKREELLNLSSEEFEAKIQTIRFQRELSLAEDKEVKRQRRLIKNRESAQMSRLKKKSQMDELQTRLNQLEAENRNLKEENKKLLIEMNKWKELCVKTKVSKTDFPETNKKAGVYLFIILLSFGLLFNYNQRFSLPSAHSPNGRVLLENGQASLISPITLAEGFEQNQQNQSQLKQKEDNYNLKQNQKIRISPEKPIQAGSEATAYFTEFTNESLPSNTSEVYLTKWVGDQPFESNTIYFYCSDVRSIGNYKIEDPSDLRVNIIFSNKANATEEKTSGDYIEISTKILDVRQFTLNPELPSSNEVINSM